MGILRYFCQLFFSSFFLFFFLFPQMSKIIFPAVVGAGLISGVFIGQHADFKMERDKTITRYTMTWTQPQFATSKSDSNENQAIKLTDEYVKEPKTVAKANTAKPKQARDKSNNNDKCICNRCLRQDFFKSIETTVRRRLQDWYR